MKLFCFPYAGGTATKFFPWRKLLPSEIKLEAVEYPGHGKNIEKPTVSDFNELIDYLLIELKEKMDTPFIFLGHSLGGLVSFELTRRLQELNLTLPTLL